MVTSNVRVKDERGGGNDLFKTTVGWILFTLNFRNVLLHTEETGACYKAREMMLFWVGIARGGHGNSNRKY